MKKSFAICKIFFSLALLIAISAQAEAQNADKQEKENARIEALKQIVEARHFEFIPQTATPMNGGTKQISGYILKVKKDTIDSDLPYYGRAYSATIGATEGGIRFTSTDFEYNSKDGARGGWDISIAPKGVRDVQTMTLSISNSGYTTVRVNSNTRQMISFYGFVEPLK